MKASAARMFAVLCLAAALLGLGFQGCVFGGGGTETESVTGKVVTPEGNPVMGASVILHPADFLWDPGAGAITDLKRNRTIQTQSDGSYEFKDLPPGEYRIEVSSSDSGGAIHDLLVLRERQTIRLTEDILRPRGGVHVNFAPDSEARSTPFVQVYGLERFVLPSALKAASSIILPNLPAGAYDLRFSTQEGFRREGIYRVEVASGEISTLDSVVLERKPKLTFDIGLDGLGIDGLDGTNPVIFDNERWDNGVDNEYIWAKASMDSLDLRGNIVTFDQKDPQRPLADQLRKCEAELRRARLAGLIDIPDPVMGAQERLTLPEGEILQSDKDLETLVLKRTAGSDLIVAEALKATPAKPLVVVVGGPLTTVAQAYLTDPSIASRMVIAGVFSFSINSSDTLALYLLAKKCRFVQWGRKYTWGGTPALIDLEGIPGSRMGDSIRAFINRFPNELSLGDLAPAAFLFRKGTWKSADMLTVSARLEATPASNITFDFLDIPIAANDWQKYADEFSATLSDLKAYHPIPMPSRLDAEGYLGNAGARFLIVDSALGEEAVAVKTGGWIEHRISVAQGGEREFTVRYRSAAGGKLVLGRPGLAPSASVELPAATEWTETPAVPIVLDPGTYMLRVGIESGAADIDWVEAR